MKVLEVFRAKEFSIVFDSIPADKSITHRAIIFSLLSNEDSNIRNILKCEDTLNTIKASVALGASIKSEGNITTIIPPIKIKEPDGVIYFGNSGTSIRIFTGLLASARGFFVLTGDKYLLKRPMGRIIRPLNSIGASIDGRDDKNLAPISIRGSLLNGFNYVSKISSAQVKSAMILAALASKGASTYKEPYLSRDHSERMLKKMGADISCFENGSLIKIKPLENNLKPLDIDIPSDPSSAFFFAVAAAIVPKAKIVLRNILLNKTRIQAYKILEKMGAKIEYIINSNTHEAVGDIRVEHSKLIAVEIKDNISWLLDELPALAIAMSFADGLSVVKNAKELRKKESDRIESVITNLTKCGIMAREFDDGYEILGGDVKSAVVDSFGDHRIAMSFAVCALRCGMTIRDTGCIMTSFPNFIDLLKNVARVVEF